MVRFQEMAVPWPIFAGSWDANIGSGPFIWRTRHPIHSLQWLGIRTPFMYQPDRLPDYD
jgi:hypothetical protein